MSPGYWFIAPYEELDQTERGKPWVGPYIYDQNGELVWSGAPLFDHYKSFDLRVAKVDGKDMMTVIYPRENAGLIVDSTYEFVKSIVYSETFDNSNMHDLNVVDNGKRALVLTKDTHKPLSKEMSKAVEFDGNCSVRADGLKELDISGSKTKTVFEWNGTDHIGLEETTFHRGTIDKMCNNNWDIQ